MPLQSSLRTGEIGVFELQVRRQKDGTYRFTSSAAKKIEGCSEEYAKGGPARSIQAVLAEVLTYLNSQP